MRLDEQLNAVPADRSAASEYRIRIDREAEFTTSKIASFKHNFDQHPLMQLDRLSLLAESLATTQQCRFVTPGITESTPFDHSGASPDGRTVREIFETIHDASSWIALYNVQTDPHYARFLQEVLASVDHVISRQERIFDIRGFIFISAPPSITPFHIDRENNFWLNVRGRKVLSVWDRLDRSVVPAKDVENFIMYRMLEGVKLTEESRAKRLDFDCGPGDGVYFPATTPHMTRSDRSWVTDADGVSISMGIDFYSNVTRHEARIHTGNSLLRKVGLSPQNPGASGLGDALKGLLGRASVSLRRKFRGYSPPPGF
jgi:hypothetical protein